MEKLGILVGYYPINRGGAEYQAYLIGKELQRHFDVFFVSIGKQEESCFEDNGFRVYTLKMPRIFSVGPAQFPLKSKILEILNHENPKFIYQRMGTALTGFATLYAKRADCKVVWHIASEKDLVPRRLSAREVLTLKFIDRMYQEYGIRHVDKIVGQAEYQNELLSKRYNRKCDIIIPNFHPLPEDSFQKSLPIKVVWIANFKKLKQPDLFIDLAEKFQENKNLKFVMVGRMDNMETGFRLKKYCSQHKNLEYLGEITLDEVGKLLCQSHILVNTSEYEGFPNTFIQAWMRKVPVLSLNVDPDNILEREKIGFHSKTFEQLKKDLEFLAGRQDLLSDMGTKAREFAIENHSLGNIGKLERILT